LRYFHKIYHRNPLPPIITRIGNKYVNKQVLQIFVIHSTTNCNQQIIDGRQYKETVEARIKMLKLAK